MKPFSRISENRTFRIQWHRFCYYSNFVKSYYYGKSRYSDKAAVHKQLWQHWVSTPAPAPEEKTVHTREPLEPATQAAQTRYQPFLEKLKSRLALIKGKVRA
ncbi:hypothetical protein JSY36_17530 [Bacillus sp. H-16]|uniref:hypothetical protein n=1 Tax=Alteribacter salitolerans TaxID=2912333 RepID=UPI0019653AE5|nr:hypothetical protein [Alteribacter salitolerans]MBM7097538.1 hypothetical protein [Alteribacter salitolerans]